ncbi:MAG: type VI secretion system protein ImpK [Oleiphilaceae bacterium]|jgi:type VI secretion system protein ImpK
MANDDDFDPFASDKTVILPRPGGSPPPGFPGQQTAPAAQVQANTTQVPTSFKVPKLEHLANAESNCILGNSLAVLSYAAQLRHLSSSPDLPKLFNDLVIQIKDIGENLRTAGQADEVIVTSRYIICSFVDEMVLNTPWGSTSVWSTKSLLSFFHKESQGGAKFFDILKKIEQQSARYIDLIEVIYVCLSFGYLGKFRMQPDGPSQISNIQENLYQTIRQLRQHQELPLSSLSTGIDTRKTAITQGKAVMLTAIVAIVVLIGAYGTMLFDLNDMSDPLTKQALQLKQDMPSLIEKQRVVIPSKAPKVPLEQLANDMAQGAVDVEKTNSGVKFVLSGKGLFKSGSAEVNNVGLVTRVAMVLKQTQGLIKIVGHTDNIPIRTINFPSNLVLSKKRAKSIGELIKSSINDREFVIEGLGDLSPLLPNTSNENRVKNRRVEIFLYSN